jgi:hypothetical protein
LTHIVLSVMVQVTDVSCYFHMSRHSKGKSESKPITKSRDGTRLHLLKVGLFPSKDIEPLILPGTSKLVHIRRTVVNNTDDITFSGKPC